LLRIGTDATQYRLPIRPVFAWSGSVLSMTKISPGRIVAGGRVPARDTRDNHQRGGTGSAYTLRQVFPGNPKAQVVFFEMWLNFN